MTPQIDALNEALAGRYVVDSEIGQGGMATVYLARDVRHEREVAIKVLREDLAASLGSGRFLREIKIAAHLQHPHILPLLDSGEAGRFLYFVMPFVKGQSLRERLAREGELPVHDAVRLLIEIVDALAEAHSHGVVHRDMKPDNVMLSGRHALVTDFGVAKAVSEATGRNTVTTLGVAVGTPAYMSPEQAVADPHVDHRSDIYSVGVMAYEMLTGRTPFVGATPQQVLAAHVTEAPDSVSKRRTAISSTLDAVIMRCLAKRPADRYQTAADMHAALEPLATPSVGVTPTETRPVDVRGSSRRHRLLIGAGCVAIAGVAAVMVASPQRGTPGARAPETVQVTSTGNVSHAAISPDGTRIAYALARCDSMRCVKDIVVQDVDGAGSLVVLQDATTVWNTEWSPDGRFLAIFGAIATRWGTFLVPASVQGPPRFVGCCFGRWLSTADSMMLSPFSGPDDTSAVMYTFTTSDLRIRDSLTVVFPPRTGFEVIPSPNGALVATTITHDRQGALQVRRRDGVITDELPLRTVPNGSVHWTRDGGALLVAVYSAGLPDHFDIMRYAVDRRGRFRGKPDTLWRSALMQDGRFSVTSDQSTLALVQGSRTNTVTAVEWLEPGSAPSSSRQLSTSTTFVNGELSPDGRRVALVRHRLAASGASQTQLDIVSFAGGFEFSVPLDTVPHLSWGERGVLITSSRSAGVSSVDLLDLSSRRVVPLFTLRDTSAQLRAWELPGARYLTIANYRDVAIRSADGALLTSVPVPDGVYYPSRVAVAPSGAEAVFAGWDTDTNDTLVVYRVRLDDGRARQVFARPLDAYDSIHWLAGGAIVVIAGETSATFALFRIAPDGAATRLGTLPFGQGHYSLSRDGLRMVASVSEPRGDVRLVKNFAALINR